MLILTWVYRDARHENGGNKEKRKLKNLHLIDNEYGWKTWVLEILHPTSIAVVDSGYCNYLPIHIVMSVTGVRSSKGTESKFMDSTRGQKYILIWFTRFFSWRLHDILGMTFHETDRFVRIFFQVIICFWKILKNWTVVDLKKTTSLSAYVHLLNV